ncbi:flagellar brake protein [Pseudoxanthomonas sp. JBR18]|uniref:flagellar brake protein n=1 Tax=Pseudoxanthomonas sp. JBR18 TaxID=2969308 RepID=UPI00230548BB|nr:flagellar brake protein [Pseudoxanthomonas sp. JBR18]WCE03697.1 flagellar brake protein [Pseudoxanthomonas sp. JBR18]
MSEGLATDSHPDASTEEVDDKYLLRNPRQIRRLLRALIDQRATLTVHLMGRDQSFASAILEVDEDEDQVLLDGSVNEASNQAAERAGTLLCFAQLDRVRVRFRIEALDRIEQNGRTAFRFPLPDSLYYLQRREFYRLETPITESPTCILRIPDSSAADPIELEARVVDISGGGLAVALPVDVPRLTTHVTYPECQLALPDHQPFSVPLMVCSQQRQVLPSGVEFLRIGLQFGQLPRGADELIQRYIFRVDRERTARRNGVA